MISRALRKWRRRRVKCQQFPDEWERVMERNCPLYERLSDADRCELRGHVQVFLAEKTFEGCGGLALTDEMRVTIAAEACILLLHRDTEYYPRLSSILVYPERFFVRTGRLDELTESDSPQALLGQSWSTGSVILSWRTIAEDCEKGDDGHNVIFHEFAHQLDLEDGAVTGAPALGEGLSYDERAMKFVHWAKVLRGEFEQLKFHHRHGRHTVLDAYGTKNPAEFFAVCVEAFFEKSVSLKHGHPELYAELAAYFLQDPATWGKRPR